MSNNDFREIIEENVIDDAKGSDVSTSEVKASEQEVVVEEKDDKGLCPKYSAPKAPPLSSATPCLPHHLGSQGSLEQL